eukprot:COSAG02_NODE_5706_length_4106_cov_1.601447_3_plen_58_part_01
MLQKARLVQYVPPVEVHCIYSSTSEVYSHDRMEIKPGSVNLLGTLEVELRSRSKPRCV